MAARKRTPVDTVALKKRQEKDWKIRDNNSTEIGSNEVGFTNAPYNKKGRDAEKRSYARGDTLDMARKGKIPVKKGKK